MATDTKAGSKTKTTKTSASATTGASASADTSKKLDKNSTASAGAYSEAEAATLKVLLQYKQIQQMVLMFQLQETHTQLHTTILQVSQMLQTQQAVLFKV